MVGVMIFGAGITAFGLMLYGIYFIRHKEEREYTKKCLRNLFK